MNTKLLFEDVLKEISLSDEEKKELKDISLDVLRRIKKAGGNAYVGGSLAKGTLVKKEGPIDVDVFVVFKTEKDTLKLGTILKKAKFKTEVVHGSRDYFHIKLDKLLLEIIPVVEIKKISEANNVTDVSLTHVKYVTQKIKNNPKLANEIILAKAFCAANNVYGAESYIGGFSGYSLEILVSYFGSFIKFLKNIGNKRTLDPEKYFKNENEILRELNCSKLNSPIVVIDPTYKYRNVCAGLHQETFDIFLKVTKEFLKKPSKEFFERKEFNLDSLKEFARKNNSTLLKLDLSTDRQEGDIAGTKMKKMLRFISEQLKRNQQSVLKSEFVYSGGKKAEGYLIVEFNNSIKFVGPKEFMIEQVKNFKRVHKKIFVEKRFVCAYEKFNKSKFFLDLKNYEKEIGVKFKLTFF